MAHGCRDRQLNTIDDFESFALSTYKSANDFYNVVDHSMDLLTQYPDAVLTNIAFSIELFLKSIFYKQTHMKCFKNGNRGPEIHNLSQIFHRLPDEIQKEITRLHPCSNITKDRFEISLEHIGDIYTVFRYSNEKTFLSCNLQFVVEFLLVLKYFSDKLFSVGNTE